MAPAQSRHIRVFISSTFRDMQAERDYLVKFIFPQLRKLCEQRAVTWGEVDLRWGITEQQSAEGKVLPICLAEIERCRPYFIGLLGERYGWVPDAIEPDLVAREPWLAEHLQHSVTELEILHGVLNNPEMAERVFFYFRDPQYLNNLDKASLPDFAELPSPDDIALYGEEGAQARADERKNKLLALKDRIRASGLPLQENFHSPKELGEWVLRDMTAMIDALFPPGSVPDALQLEAQLHEAFARSRAQLYIGGEKYYPQVDAHMGASRLPLLVLGESGSGKSALLANWALRYQAEHPEELVLTHFIGASPASADLAAMLRRLMTELKQRFDLPGEIPTDEQKLSADFPNWLFMAAAKGSFTLVLDALNQLEERLGARQLHWLPNELPENVHVLVSSLPGPALEAAQERKWPALTIQPLSPEERRQLTREFLARYAKQLGDALMEKIISDPQSANPLGLRLLLDELRQFGSHENLEAEMERYLAADSIPSLFQLVLTRCERDYETDRPGLVREALSLLWAARRGLSEAELLDMLGAAGLPLPQRAWAPLALALEGALFERGGLLNFFHGFIRQAVESRYLPSEAEQVAAHLRVADYFASQEENLPRKIEELPWQLQQARAWSRLYALLADISFFEALYESDKQEVAIYWAAVEANSDFRRTEAYQGWHEQGLPLHVLNWLSIDFQRSGNLEEAMDLLTEQERVCREEGNQDDLGRILGNQALILSDWGRLPEAMDLLKEQERICRELGNLDSLSISLGNQALILRGWGRLPEAMDLHKEEERICRELGNLDGLSACLGNQALILRGWGRLPEAMDLHKEEERICRELGIQDGLQGSLGNQALILKAWGRLQEAMDLLKEQERICRELGNQDGLQACLGNQALILRRWGRLPEAMDMQKQKERICRELGNQDSLSISLGNQANILYAWGRLPEAMDLLKKQEHICRELNNPEGLSMCLVNQGLVLGKKGEGDKQIALVQEALAIAQEHGLTRVAAQIEAVLKRIDPPSPPDKSYS